MMKDWTERRRIIGERRPNKRRGFGGKNPSQKTVQLQTCKTADIWLCILITQQTPQFLKISLEPKKNSRKHYKGGISANLKNKVGPKRSAHAFGKSLSIVFWNSNFQLVALFTMLCPHFKKKNLSFVFFQTHHLKTHFFTIDHKTIFRKVADHNEQKPKHTTLSDARQHGLKPL